MTGHAYNYATFNMQTEMGVFTEFQDLPLHAGKQAPDFPLEDLDSGQIVPLKDLWSAGFVLIEFGSYT